MDCDKEQSSGARMEARSSPAVRLPLDRSSALPQAAYGVFQLKGQGTAGTTGPLCAAFHPLEEGRFVHVQAHSWTGGEGEPRAGGALQPLLLVSGFPCPMHGGRTPSPSEEGSQCLMPH